MSTLYAVRFVSIKGEIKYYTGMDEKGRPCFSEINIPLFYQIQADAIRAMRVLANNSSRYIESAGYVEVIPWSAGKAIEELGVVVVNPHV
jgi:hypothetical protein